MEAPAAASPRSMAGDDWVAVPRPLVREVVADKCCPLHLRIQLSRVLDEVETAPEAATSGAPVMLAVCLATPHLPMEEALCVRAACREALQWATPQGAVPGPGGPGRESARCAVHHRIQVRLWMRRITDLTRGTKDESVFDTRMKLLADDTLRTRMETEMQEALLHMETQLRSFQQEVDRRLEEQEDHVRRLVNERVQKELDVILARELSKMQELVEERVRSRVDAVFKNQVSGAVQRLQGSLDLISEENGVLRDAFAEANLRAKTLFWAVHPPALKLAAMRACCGIHLASRTLGGSLHSRLEMASHWPGIPFRAPVGEVFTTNEAAAEFNSTRSNTGGPPQQRP